MGGRAQHRHRGHDGEGGVGDQTQPVQHHGSKLPVALHCSGLLVVPDLVRDDLDLLQDEAEFPVQRVVGDSLSLRLDTAGGAGRNITDVSGEGERDKSAPLTSPRSSRWAAGA